MAYSSRFCPPPLFSLALWLTYTASKFLTLPILYHNQYVEVDTIKIAADMSDSVK
jgi:hypothetical protein